MVYLEVGVGQDSSVDTVTHNRLYSSRIKFWWGQDFPHPFRLALGPTQPPIQWVFPRDTAAGVWHLPPIPI